MATPTKSFSWDDTKSHLEKWCMGDRQVDFAHIEAPPACGKSTGMMMSLCRMVGEETTISYTTGSPTEKEWIESNAETRCQSLKVFSDSLAAVQNLERRVKKGSRGGALVMFDFDEDLGIEFILAMLALSRIAHMWQGPGKLRVVWLASVAWNPILSRIMAIFKSGAGVEGVSVTRIRVTMEVAPRKKEWEIYSGRKWTEKNVSSLAERICKAHDGKPSQVLVCTGKSRVRHFDMLARKLEGVPNIQLIQADIADPKAARCNEALRVKQLRHIVVLDYALAPYWNPQISQVVTFEERLSNATIRRQIDWSSAGDVGDKVTIHSLGKVDEALPGGQAVKFESLHLESFLFMALLETDLSIDKLMAVFASDFRRWEAAVHRLFLAGLIRESKSDSNISRLSFLVGDDFRRCDMMRQLLPLVGWDFSTAYLLGATVDAPNSKTVKAIVEVACIMYVWNRGDPLFVYDIQLHQESIAKGIEIDSIAQELDRDCRGIPAGLSREGSIWMALGIYRQVCWEFKNGALESGRPWSSPSKRVNVNLARFIRVYSCVQQLGEEDKDLYYDEIDASETEDWGFVAEQLLLANLDKIAVIATANEEYPAPIMTSLWPGYHSPTKLEQAGFLPRLHIDASGDDANREAIFLMGSGLLLHDDRKTHFLKLPTVVDHRSLGRLLEKRGLTIGQLSVPR